MPISVGSVSYVLWPCFYVSIYDLLINSEKVLDKCFFYYSSRTENMDFWKHASSGPASSLTKATSNFSNTVQEMAQLEQQERVLSQNVENDVGVDLREIYFLIMHFLSSGPCQKTFRLFWDELLEHELLPRRYHAWFSRSGEHSGNNDDDGISFPLNFNKLVERYMLLFLWPH